MTQIVASAARRAGLPPVHAHRLRHSEIAALIEVAGTLRLAQRTALTEP